MDYQGKYNGPQIDRRLDFATKIIGIEPLMVIAGKRIPRERFGPIGTIRFSKTPTFVMDEDLGTHVFYCPVLSALLELNILDGGTYSGSVFEMVEGRPGYVRDIEALAKPGKSYQFHYVDRGMNAIKKISDSGYKSVIINSAKTQTDNLIIQNGDIICVQPVGVKVEKAGTSVLTIRIDTSSIIEYRRTGKHPRKTYGGYTTRKHKKYLILSATKRNEYVQKVGRWIYRPGKYFRGKATLEFSRPDGSTLNVAMGLMRQQYSSKRIQLDVRVRAIYRKRWRSIYYTEVNEMVMI